MGISGNPITQIALRAITHFRSNPITASVLPVERQRRGEDPCPGFTSCLYLGPVTVCQGRGWLWSTLRRLEVTGARFRVFTARPAELFRHYCCLHGS